VAWRTDRYCTGLALLTHLSTAPKGYEPCPSTVNSLADQPNTFCVPCPLTRTISTSIQDVKGNVKCASISPQPDTPGVIWPIGVPATVPREGWSGILLSYMRAPKYQRIPKCAFRLLVLILCSACLNNRSDRCSFARNSWICS
jgi:hypothetical protein